MTREEILDEIFEFLKTERPLHFSGTPLNKNPDFVKDKKYFYDTLCDSELVENIQGDFGSGWHYHFLIYDQGQAKLRGIKYSQYIQRIMDEQTQEDHITALDFRIKELTEKNLDLELIIKKRRYFDMLVSSLIGAIAGAIIGFIIAYAIDIVQVVKWLLQ